MNHQLSMMNFPLANVDLAENPHLATATLLAQPSTTQDPGGQREDFGKSSPLGLLLLVVLLIAVFLLVRSMTKHLRKVPQSFDDQPKRDNLNDSDKSGE